MLWAKETGKIQSGEAGLRGVRKDLESLLGKEVDISVIRQGGQFDKGPYMQLPRPGQGSTPAPLMVLPETHH